MENNKPDLNEAIKALRAKNEEKLRKDYEVGYGKPPKDTRFKKGRSGNPAGRQEKFSCNLRIYLNVIFQKASNLSTNAIIRLRQMKFLKNI